MPVLETADKIAPRSALRHRPIHSGDDRDALAVTPIDQRAHRPRPAPMQTGDGAKASPAPGTLPFHKLLLTGEMGVQVRL